MLCIHGNGSWYCLEWIVMDVYLRASNGHYLSVEKDEYPQVQASGERAAYDSLISIEKYDPTARGLNIDMSLISGGTVILRTCDGRLMAPDDYGMLHSNGATAGK